MAMSLFSACGSEEDDELCKEKTLTYAYSELAEYKMIMRDNLTNKHTYRNDSRDYIYIIYKGDHQSNLAQLWEAIENDPGADVVISSGMTVKNATVLSVTTDKDGDIVVKVRECPEEEQY